VQPRKPTYFLTGVAAGAAAVLELPVVFTAGFTACFLVCFFTLAVVAAGAPLPLAGGVAGVCAANVKGSVAKARAMVIKVVFILFISLAGFLAMPAHNPIMRPKRLKHDSLRRLFGAPNSGPKWLRFVRVRREDSGQLPDTQCPITGPDPLGLVQECA
jgi:hypothetical protein